MFGLGTIINVLAIILGGLLGSVAGKVMNDRIQDTLMKVCGVGTLFVALSGVMEKMLVVTDGKVSSTGGMLVIICLAIGGLIGELLNIEDGLERFGQWLKVKTGNSREVGFVDAFVTASLTVCIGAMAIVGSIQDGLTGDYSILATKAVLDLIIIMVMTASMGRGCVFSAVPVAMLQGGVTILATWIKVLMTDAALANLSLVGNVLIFCVGVNLVWGKKVRVANLLPAIVAAVVAAFIPGI